MGQFYVETQSNRTNLGQFSGSHHLVTDVERRTNTESTRKSQIILTSSGRSLIAMDFAEIITRITRIKKHEKIA